MRAGAEAPRRALRLCAEVNRKHDKMVETWLKVYGDAKDVVLGVEAA
jgi:hypothetical protein